MVRSSGIPRGRAIGGIARIISARASATTITRVTTTTGALDEETETTTEHSERIWLFDPEESSIQAPAGERVTGDLGGLAVEPDVESVDIQSGDRVTYGGVEYKVDSVVAVPDDGNPRYHQISFVRRQ